jgi:regulator of protease activity HflC (stomatin/prohibitin superfamily)
MSQNIPLPIKQIKIGAYALGALILTVFLNPFSTVPTGMRGVVTSFGAIKRIEQEGLVVLPPWQQLTVFNVRAEQATIEGAEGSTSDTQPVKVSLTVRYSISTDRVAEVFEKYSRNGDLSSYVQTATQEVFKAVTARYTAPDLISQRAQVSSDISEALKAKLSLYGANVIAVDMRNFSFSDTYMAAINQKVTQEQLRLVAENQLKTVEAEHKADGEAYANLKIATAQAESLKIQNAALSQNKDVLDLRRIEVEKVKAERWNGQLPQNVYAGAPIPYFDVNKPSPHN